MDYFSRNRILYWCILVLVAINAVALASFWMKKTPTHPSGNPPAVPNGQAILEERLGLSADQAKQFELLRREHFANTRPLQNDMHKVRMDLLAELFSDEPDQAGILQMTETLGSMQTQFEGELYAHFQEMKEACDERQAVELRHMLTDLIERSRPREPGHRPREPHGPRRGMGPAHHPLPPPQ